jgi:hypothetical protein
VTPRLPGTRPLFPAALLAALCGLAALTAFLAPAAQAEEVQLTALCQATQAGRECSEEAEDVYALGTPFAATSSNLKISSSFLGIPTSVGCTGSSLEGETTEASETTELEGVVSALTFSGCTESFGKTACTIEAINLPYSAAVTHQGQSTGNGGVLLWKASAEQRPAFYGECSSVGLQCVFEANESKQPESAEGSVDALSMQLVGGAPASLKANSVSLKKTTPPGGNCLGAAATTASGEYSAAEPSPAFVEMVPILVNLNPEPLNLKVKDVQQIFFENQSPEASVTVFGFGFPIGGSSLNTKTCMMGTKGAVLQPKGKCEVELTCKNALDSTFQVRYGVPGVSAFSHKTPFKCT